MALVALLLVERNFARMQVERNAEPLDLGPERPELRQVVIDDGVGSADLRIAVDQRALEAEIVDAAGKFTRGFQRILHRQRGETCKTVRTPGDLFGQHVVGLTRGRDRLRRIRNRLDAAGIEREHLHRDAGCVHLLQPFVMKVRQPRLDLAPIALRRPAVSDAFGLRGGEMFLDGDLVLHRRRFPLWRRGKGARLDGRAPRIPEILNTKFVQAAIVLC